MFGSWDMLGLRIFADFGNSCVFLVHFVVVLVGFNLGFGMLEEIGMEGEGERRMNYI